MIKPGYKTSEFWFTLVSFLFSGAYLLGLISDHSQKEDLIAETSRGLEALILIIGQLAVLFRYVKGRTEIKKTWWDTATPEERQIANNKNTNLDNKSTKTKPKKSPKKPVRKKQNNKEIKNG